jgi:hypothetical protein
MLEKLVNAVNQKFEIGTEREATTSISRKERIIAGHYEGRYEPLYLFLVNHEGSEITLTVQQIEEILGFRLRDSARQYSAWWANDVTHSQAKAWIFAGWESEKVRLNESTTFRKIAE